MDLLRAGDRGVVREDVRHEQRRARALVHLHTRAALPLRLAGLAPPWFVRRILMVSPTEIVRQPTAVENARAARVCQRPEARRELVLDEVAGGVAADSLEQFRPSGSD
jgi:hypothetical protein